MAIINKYPDKMNIASNLVKYDSKYSNIIKPVNHYTKDGKFVRRWESLLEVQRTLGFFESCLNVVVIHKPHHHSAYVFKWFYVDDPTQPNFT